MGLTFALAAAAIGIGSVHALAPDHWMPFATLARAERWSAKRTAALTALCGLGHVTVSVVLGLVAALFGLELIDRLGRRLESLGGFLLIAFGLAYGLWGLHRAVRARWHDHRTGDVHPHWHAAPHGRDHHHSDRREGRVTAWTLFVVFSVDPCVAAIPLVFAAAPLGVATTAAVVLAYEAATIGTMVLLALPARSAVALVSGAWADRYGDALAGGVIAAVGLAVVALGI